MRERNRWIVAGALISLGCSREQQVRPQVLLTIDTNAPLVGQLATDVDLSADAAIDTVRIDVLSDRGVVLETRELIAPAPEEWPLSLGVVAGDSTDAGKVLLRVRAFRGTRADVGTKAALPWPSATIDRLVAIKPAVNGVLRWRVTLDLSCVGVAADMMTLESCASNGQIANVSDSLSENSDPEFTAIGSSPLARARDCSGRPRSGARCVPGGFFFLGDPSLESIPSAFFEESLPLHPTVISPFWIDETEFTVGRLRELVVAGRLPDPSSEFGNLLDTEAAFCTWRGVDDDSRDHYPVNCVSHSLAVSACEESGGHLVSEAQWEFAARGRGQARTFPWGDKSPECCSASLGRRFDEDTVAMCRGTGLEPVGSHTDAEGCAVVDASRDGVLDFAGGVAEWVADSFASYDDACWGNGVLDDPLCRHESIHAFGQRGGNWASGPQLAQLALRYVGSTGATTGFRCSYEDSP